MKHGRRGRGPIHGVSRVSRAEGADVILRVRALERIGDTTPVAPRPAPQRSFSQVLERHERGLHRAEPLPAPTRSRPLPAPEPEEEPPQALAPVPDTFLGLLWLKLKGGR